MRRSANGASKTPDAGAVPARPAIGGCQKAGRVVRIDLYGERYPASPPRARAKGRRSPRQGDHPGAIPGGSTNEEGGQSCRSSSRGVKCCGFVFGAADDEDVAEAIRLRWREHHHHGPPWPRTRSGITDAVRRVVYTRDGWTCRYCGRTCDRSTRTLDHVIPRSRRGPSTPDNLVVACRKCNGDKGDRLL